MGLFGPSRVEELTYELRVAYEDRLLQTNYIRNLEALLDQHDPETLAKLKAAHQSARTEAYRLRDGQINFSLRPNFRVYRSEMWGHQFQVYVEDPEE